MELARLREEINSCFLLINSRNALHKTNYLLLEISLAILEELRRINYQIDRAVED